MSMLDEITVDKTLEIMGSDDPDWRKVERMNDLVEEVKEYRSLSFVEADNDCGGACTL